MHFCCWCFPWQFRSHRQREKLCCSISSIQIGYEVYCPDQRDRTSRDCKSNKPKERRRKLLISLDISPFESLMPAGVMWPPCFLGLQTLFAENEDKSRAKFMGYRCKTVWCDEAFSTFWQWLRNYPMWPGWIWHPIQTQNNFATKRMQPWKSGKGKVFATVAKKGVTSLLPRWHWSK